MDENFTDLITLQLLKINRKLDELNALMGQVLSKQDLDLGDRLPEEKVKLLLELGTTSLWGFVSTP